MLGEGVPEVSEGSGFAKMLDAVLRLRDEPEAMKHPFFSVLWRWWDMHGTREFGDRQSYKVGKAAAQLLTHVTISITNGLVVMNEPMESNATDRALMFADEEPTSGGIVSTYAIKGDEGYGRGTFRPDGKGELASVTLWNFHHPQPPTGEMAAHLLDLVLKGDWAAVQLQKLLRQ